jgi:hypothetical protein
MPVGAVKSFDASRGYGLVKARRWQRRHYCAYQQDQKAGDVPLVDRVRERRHNATKDGKQVARGTASPLEGVIMMKGFAIALVCIGTLVTLDHEFYSGVYTDQVLRMLRQIGSSFGY